MPHQIACVSFLNSKPLIDPLVGRPDVHIHFAVPSQLLPLLESSPPQATTGLLSIVDYQSASADLLLLPAGMIGCDGPTLTVRLYSRIDPAKIRTLAGDTDSHTSVILAQLILRERFGIAPTLVPLPADFRTQNPPEALLLIGDKVINAAPDSAAYPHQLDLGEAWKSLTGLPFVFAMWMIRRDFASAHPEEALALARLLDSARRRGAELTEELLTRHAAEKRWPPDLARKYFTHYLRYQVTPEARRGLAHFFHLAAKHHLLPTPRQPEYLEFE